MFTSPVLAPEPRRSAGGGGVEVIDCTCVSARREWQEGEGAFDSDATFLRLTMLFSLLGGLMQDAEPWYW